MSEQEFAALQALFAEPASFPDAADFARRMQHRVRNRRRARFTVLGTGGAVAGVVSVQALIASGIPVQVGRALDPLLQASGRFGIYWIAVGALLLLALALVANLDDACPMWDGANLP